MVDRAGAVTVEAFESGAKYRLRTSKLGGDAPSGPMGRVSRHSIKCRVSRHSIKWSATSPSTALSPLRCNAAVSSDSTKANRTCRVPRRQAASHSPWRSVQTHANLPSLVTRRCVACATSGDSLSPSTLLFSPARRWVRTCGAERGSARRAGEWNVRGGACGVRTEVCACGRRAVVQIGAISRGGQRWTRALTAETNLAIV